LLYTCCVGVVNLTFFSKGIYGETSSFAS
jgi:hypothetical protein